MNNTHITNQIADITNFIFVSKPPTKTDIADVILLPGCGNPDIPERAVELFKEGFAPKIIASGGVGMKLGKFAGVFSKQDVYNGDYQTDCEFFVDVLQKNGVPESAIIQENQSRFTKENGLFSRKVADENGLIVKTAILVCKSFHARRSLICYQLAFPEADIFVVPVDVYGITSENWHLQDYGVERVLGELTRCGNQFVEELKPQN